MDNQFPDDIEQLKALLVAQRVLIQRLSGEITGYGREIDALQWLVAKLQRMLFGRSSDKNLEKIEKKIAQVEKRTTELQDKHDTVQSQLSSMAGDTAQENVVTPGRKPLSTTLPRERRGFPPQEAAYPACSGRLKTLRTAGYHQYRLQGNRNGSSKAGLQPV